MVEDEDEPVTLSAHALAALAEFREEKDAHEAKFKQLQTNAEADAALSMEAFAEDWNESQFWYSANTAHLLAVQLLDGATTETIIGVVSAPSVFLALRNILSSKCVEERPKLVLLEHDSRFGVFPEFTFYDFQQPFKLPETLKGTMNRLICDPPFLSQDCQTKAAMTVNWLLKQDCTIPPRVIVCTGERMADLVVRLYRKYSIRSTTFEPKHARGLSNEFSCYANFECTDWMWQDQATK